MIEENQKKKLQKPRQKRKKQIYKELIYFKYKK